MLTIDPDRLLGDLRTLRRFGAVGTGVVRQSLTEVDLDARRWLCERMIDSGLDARIDGVGNVIGRSPLEGPALLIGSHSDTQPAGGWLDGALGVVYGLEIARSCMEASVDERLAVDAVAWVDEEGTFGTCLGSRSFLGLVSREEFERATNDAGVSLADALEAAGLDGIAALPEQGRYRGYLEAHIEQGANLERDDNWLGVVSTIVGSRDFTIRFVGQQNHAGTTPMHLRADAARAMIDVGYRINRLIGELASRSTVWTIGRLSVDPGAASIVPGSAEMHLQFRDPELAMIEAIDAAIHRSVSEADGNDRVEVTIERASSPIDPARMDPVLQRHMANAAEQQAPGRWVSMPSAAVHDAMFVAEVMPAGMLFIPSIGGVSHDFAENTSDEDIVRGCEVMATAVESILSD
ncbi:MAG: hydantoinase/carbamoylase family amidase [Acidimicrobiales bacterium]